MRTTFLVSCVVSIAHASQHLIWLSDTHLDLAYDPTKSQHAFCREDTTSQSQLDLSVIESLLLNNGDAIAAVKRRLVLPPGSNSVPLQAAPLYNHTRSPPRRRKDTVDNYEWEVERVQQGPDDIAPVENSAMLNAYFGRYGCDSPPSLLWSIIDSIKLNSKSLFLLHTGDLAAHYWLPEHDHLRFLSMAIAGGIYSQFAKYETQPLNLTEWSGDSIGFLNMLALSNHVERERPIDVVMAIGNNDLEGDYVVTENGAWNQDVYDLWKGWVVPETEKESFVRGMYYKKNITDDLVVLVLNSVWYHHLAVDENNTKITDKFENDPAADPAGQFAWLEAQLQDAKANGKQVLIAGHVPPAKSLFRNTFLGFTVDTEWSCTWTRKYEMILDQYRDVIKGQFFGHIHTDEFRIELSYDKHHPHAKGLILINPSISPVHANNPSWRKMRVNADTMEIKGYDQHYSALYGYMRKHEYFGTFDRSRLLKVDQRYNSHHTIGPIASLTPAAVFDEVNEYILRSQKRTYKWWQNQLVHGGGPPEFVVRCILMERFEIHHDVRKCVQKAVERGSNSTNAISQSSVIYY